MIDEHSATATIAAALLDVREGEVTTDESWAPFAQADIRLPLPDDLAELDSTDPRSGGRVRLEFGRGFWQRWPNSDVTAVSPGATNAALTAMFSGANAAITAAFSTPYNALGRDSEFRQFDLGVRDRQIDHVAKVVTLSLASDEALLQDYAHVATTAYISGHSTLRGLIGYVLSLVGATLESGTADAVLTPGVLSWQPGDSAWEFLRSPIEAATLRLWCDENRRWQLTERAPLAPGGLALKTGPDGTLTRAVDRINRDTDWYDAIVIRYRWVDANGATQTAYDVAGDPQTATRVWRLERDQQYPGPGAAAQMLKQAAGRGRELTLTAVSDYRATPGQAVTAELPGTPLQSGVVSAVTWRAPEFEMDVKTRGLIDIPATAWAFDPPGVSWNDIPVGVDWTEDI